MESASPYSLAKSDLQQLIKSRSSRIGFHPVSSSSQTAKRYSRITYDGSIVPDLVACSECQVVMTCPKIGKVFGNLKRHLDKCKAMPALKLCPDSSSPSNLDKDHYKERHSDRKKRRSSHHRRFSSSDAERGKHKREKKRASEHAASTGLMSHHSRSYLRHGSKKRHHRRNLGYGDKELL